MSLDFEPRLGTEALYLLFSRFSRKFSPPGVGFMSFSSALCRHLELPWRPTHEIVLEILGALFLLFLERSLTASRFATRVGTNAKSQRIFICIP